MKFASILSSKRRPVALEDTAGKGFVESIKATEAFSIPSWSPLLTLTWLQRPAPGLRMSTSCTRSLESKFCFVFYKHFSRLLSYYGSSDRLNPRGRLRPPPTCPTLIQSVVARVGRTPLPFKSRLTQGSKYRLCFQTTQTF